MNMFRLIVAVLMVVELNAGQQSELAELSQQHGLLTADCRAIRGHAKRIVEEASVTNFNSSVAAAHLSEVVKFVISMEKRLQGTKKLLTADQMKLVAADYTALEKVCSKLKNLSSGLETEFAKAKPDRIVIMDLARDLRTEMTKGNDVHVAMMSRLQIK